MVIKVYQIGNTVIEIHDSALVKTQEEIDQILARIAEIAKSKLVN